MEPTQARRILIVEDEQVIALDLRDALEELGYCVVGIAATSDDALQQATQQKPELTLMDIRIKGSVDGIETAARLRQLLDLPVVYLTSNAEHNTINRALETEPAGYLVKPYDARSLHLTIQVALRRIDAERKRDLAHKRERRRFEQRSDELTLLAEQLKAEAETDSLTHLHNRRYLDHLLSEQLKLSEREGQALGFILLDIDEFKSVNDSYGHLAGDEVLRAIGAYLLKNLRGRDVACRYGGEEIAIVAPGVSLSDAIGLAERLREGIQALSVEAEQRRLTVTASFGVSAFPEHGMEPALLLRAADAALYQAKQAGRNRVVVAAM